MDVFGSHTHGLSTPMKQKAPASTRRPTKTFVDKKSTSSPTKQTSSPLSHKKRAAPIDNDDDEVIFIAERKSNGSKNTPSPKKRVKSEDSTEKRLRRFRSRPPQTYLERLNRVRTQRMFLIERNRSISDDGTHEEEILDIAGTTGNIYQVTITKVPNCSCPDSMRGNHCKHIVYAMVNILKAPSHLAYQLALLSTELENIFAAAPITKQLIDDCDTHATDTGGKRKPIEGDCPVCVMPFEEGDDLVWCKAACGQNIHRECFNQWQRSKPGQIAKCVYCRSAWKGETGDLSGKGKGGVKNADGYVNIAGELGISGDRDMSTYHSYWVARQRGNWF